MFVINCTSAQYKSSCSGELEAESQNDSVPHEIIFVKEQNILASLEKSST